MNNMQVVKLSLAKIFPLPAVVDFLQWVTLTQADLVRLVERNPEKAITQLTEILRIARGC